MCPTQPTRFDLGGCTITLINGGALKLDGGAMFGIIPRPLWSRDTPADEKNRIRLACNCLLVEWQGESARRAIIESGHGAKYGEKEREIYGIDPSTWLLPSLTEIGVDPDGITDVVLTHLHLDHAGGITQSRDGQIVPTFPNAKVHVQKQEFDDARANFGIMKVSYREENFTPIDEIDAWVLHEGETTPLPGIRLRPSPGHTRGHQSVLIEGRDRTAIFVGDVMPTRHHVGLPYNMSYDLYPLDNVETKRKLLTDAAEHDWMVVIDHEPDEPVLRVVEDRGRMSLVR